MSGHPMSEGPRPFTSAELDGAEGVPADELASHTRVARELEGLAARTPVVSTPALTDRVMAAVAGEPAPAPARVAGRALRRRSLGGFLVALRDAWRVTLSPGFPMAVRAQAIALVLVVIGAATGSAMVTAGALGLFDEQPPSPVPTITTPTPSPEDTSATPEGSTSPEPSESAEPSESPGESPEPSDTAEPSSDGGSGGASSTAQPTDDNHTPEPTRTPSPTSTPHEDSHTPSPTSTPDGGATPTPSPTPGGDG